MRRRKTVCILSDARIFAVVIDVRGGSREIQTRGDAVCTVPSSLLADPDIESLTGAIVGALEDVDASGDSVTLVVPLSWCFTHVLTPSSSRARARVLAYELEPSLPLPLEEVTCAFAPLKDGEILAVAIPTAPMEELLAALLRRGVHVAHVTLDVVATGMDEPLAILDSRWVRAVFPCDGSHDLRLTTLEANGTCRKVGQLTSRLAQRVADYGGDAGKWRILDIAGGGQDEPAWEDETEYVGPDEAVEMIARGASVRRPTLDLRTDGLAATAGRDAVVALARHCLAAALALLMFAAGSMHVQTRSIRTHVQRVDEVRREVYVGALGGNELPPGAAMRLASERIRLEGLTRNAPATDDAMLPSSRSPLDTLREIVDRLPKDVRVMLVDAQLDERQLTLRGQTAEHRDAERIMEAVGAVPGLSARQPRTSRLASGGVEFSIVGVADDVGGHEQ